MEKIRKLLTIIIEGIRGLANKPRTQETILIDTSSKEPKDSLASVKVGPQQLTDTQEITKAQEEFINAVNGFYQHISDAKKGTAEYCKLKAGIKKFLGNKRDNLEISNEETRYYKDVPDLNRLFDLLIVKLQDGLHESDDLLGIINNFDKTNDETYLSDKGKQDKIKSLHMAINIGLGMLTPEERKDLTEEEKERMIETKLQEFLQGFEDDYKAKRESMQKATANLGTIDGLWIALIKSLNNDLMVPEEVKKYYGVSTVSELQDRFNESSLEDLRSFISIGFEGDEQRFYTDLFDGLIINTTALVSKDSKEFVDKMVEQFRNKKDINDLKLYLYKLCEGAKSISLDKSKGTRIPYIKDGNPILSDSLEPKGSFIETEANIQGINE